MSITGGGEANFLLRAKNQVMAGRTFLQQPKSILPSHKFKVKKFFFGVHYFFKRKRSNVKKFKAKNFFALLQIWYLKMLKAILHPCYK